MSIIYERMQGKYRDDRWISATNDFFSFAENRVTLEELEDFLLNPSEERMVIMDRARYEQGEGL